MIEVDLLGSLEVRIAGRVVAVRSAKQRALLARLGLPRAVKQEHDLTRGVVTLPVEGPETWVQAAVDTFRAHGQ